MTASTAPQLSWPSTRIRGAPSAATAYSRLAIVSLVAKFPATRQTKRSPRALSKFRRDAGICAAQYCGVRVLALGQSLALMLEIMALRQSRDVARISLSQTFQR